MLPEASLATAIECSENRESLATRPFPKPPYNATPDRSPTEEEEEYEKTIDLLLKRVKTDTLADGMEEQIRKVEEMNEFIPRGELVFPKS